MRLEHIHEQSYPQTFGRTSPKSKAIQQTMQDALNKANFNILLIQRQYNSLNTSKPVSQLLIALCQQHVKKNYQLAAH